MPHTKFQDHRPFGSREDFFKVVTIYGYGGHLGHKPFVLTFIPSSYGGYT